MSPYCHNPPLGTAEGPKFAFETLMRCSNVRFGNKNHLQNVGNATHATLAHFESVFRLFWV